jgi:hypothetical protein
MKENTKIIIGVIIGIVISSTISITATTMIQADKVSYKTSNGDTTDVNSALDRLFDLNTVNEKIGSTNISSIGNGTITGAISNLNDNISSKQNSEWTYFTTTTARNAVTLPENINEIYVLTISSDTSMYSYSFIIPKFILDDDLNIGTYEFAGGMYYYGNSTGQRAIVQYNSSTRQIFLSRLSSSNDFSSQTKSGIAIWYR